MIFWKRNQIITKLTEFLQKIKLISGPTTNSKIIGLCSTCGECLVFALAILLDMNLPSVELDKIANRRYQYKY
jgi:hypothetical protein